MKLSEIIAQLQNVMAKRGDINVETLDVKLDRFCLTHDGFNEDGTPIDRATVNIIDNRGQANE